MIIIGDINTENEIIDFVNQSKPNQYSNFSVLTIKEQNGWIYIDLEKDKKKFYIQYSTVMTDTFDLIQFLAEIINLKDDIAFFPDNEGSLPLLYVKSIDEKNIRFIFAHDYELYASFANNIIDDYDLNLYKIECDILIDKKIFLKEFYKILSPFVNNYNLKEVYAQTFNIKKAKMYMDKISDYLY